MKQNIYRSVDKFISLQPYNTREKAQLFSLHLSQNTFGGLVIRLKAGSCWILGDNWGHWNRNYLICWFLFIYLTEDGVSATLDQGLD